MWLCGFAQEMRGDGGSADDGAEDGATNTETRAHAHFPHTQLVPSSNLAHFSGIVMTPATPAAEAAEVSVLGIPTLVCCPAFRLSFAVYIISSFWLASLFSCGRPSHLSSCLCCPIPFDYALTNHPSSHLSSNLLTVKSSVSNTNSVISS